MTTKEEKKKKTIAALYTLGINVVVFLILFFAAAWRTAGYGEGEYAGIEVNLGYDDQGSGNIQPTEPVGSQEATDDENPPLEKTDAPVDDTPEQVASTETQSPKEEIVQPQTVTDPNSDVVIKEEKKEVKPVENPETKKPVDKVEKPVEKKVEQPKVDQQAVYKSKTTSTNPATSGDGEGKQGAAGGEGDDVGKSGDKGVEGGIEGAAVYKGTPGGGDGGTLVINGWDWDKIEKPQVPPNERGQVVYEIEVDENGDLLKITKASGVVSAATDKACREAIQKITFTKKPGATVPAVTKGKITFVIVSR